MSIPEKTRMDAEFWREIERSQRLSPQERVRIGHELFERAIYLMTQGLRMQFPDASDDEIAALRRERLARQRALETKRYEIGRIRQARAGDAQ